MAFVDDQDPVEQLAAQRCDHAFTDRVRLGCLGWAGEDLDAVRGEDRIEGSGEPRVPVSEQGRHAGGTVGEVPQEGAGGLGSSCTARVCGDPGGGVNFLTSRRYGVAVGFTQVGG